MLEVTHAASNLPLPLKLAAGSSKNTLDVNGRIFVPEGQMAGEGITGYYVHKPNGVLLLDDRNVPFAFIVANKHRECFFVSCSPYEGRIWYMHSTTDADSKKLGLDQLGYAAERQLAENIFAQVRNLHSARQHPPGDIKN